jgi:hypothetical protein
MGFSFDLNNNLKQSKMFLANPQGKDNYVGGIIGAKNIKIKKVLTNLYELDFVIYEKENNEYTECYDKIAKPRLIEVQNIGWFQIVNAQETQDENSKEPYKNVKCYLLENSLIYRKVHDIVGTFGLYDIADTEHSLLHIISAECGWQIGHISNSLLNKWRTFDIDSMQIYNLLTTEVSDSFGCLFKFDSYTKTINVFTIDEIGIPTNIIISKKNILKEWVRDDSTNAIITKIHVKGGDDGNGGNVDIRAVNFGRNYLFNPSYFMNINWVSQGLVDAWNIYTTALNSASTSYTTVINNLKNKHLELLVLETALTDLISLKSAQDNIIGTSVQLHGRVPISSDTDYTIYQNAITLIATYTSQIVTKKSLIALKKVEIATLEASLNTISNGIDESNYFTTDQLNELNLFITEGDDFEDGTYIITDIMTETEVIDMKLELKQNASNELDRISQPQYTITVNASNLFTIQEDKDELISYQEWRDSFEVGNIITLKLSDSYWITVRLMSMTIDFDNPSEIELTFSNKDRLEDELILLAELLAESGRAASAYSMKSFGYDSASKITSQVREFINGSLNATTNSMFNNDNVETEFGKFGIKNKQWLPDQNKYSNYQSWWNQNTLLFSSDAFKTAKAAIGLITLASGEKVYGFIGEAIISNIVISEALSINNTNNSIIMNKDGATFKNCDIAITNGTNTIKLSPSNGFQILKGLTQTFYADVNGNLNIVGNINATGGTISGNLTVTGTLTGGTFYSAVLSGGSININNKFLVNSNGVLTATDGNFSGTITGSSISGSTISSVGTSYSTTITNGYISTGYVSLMNGANSTYILPNSIQVGNADSTLYITANSIFGNGVTFLTSGNYSTWCASKTHSHSSYASNSDLSSLESRVSALESA